MKKMRRILPVVLALLSFSACGKTAEEPARLPQETPPQHAELRMLSWGDDDGIYQLIYQNEQALLGYVDYETAQQTPLCAQPNCDHSTESCTAWLLPETFTGPVLPINEEKILFYNEPWDSYSQESRALWTANRDGSNRQELVRLSTGQHIWPASFGERIEGLFVADDQDLYFLLNEDGENIANDFRDVHSWLCRVPINGGESEKLMKDRRVLGCRGRELLLCSGNVDFEARSASYQLSVYNVDTQEERPLPVKALQNSTEIAEFFWAGEKLLWVTPYKPGPINWVDLDGSCGEIPVQWPQDVLEEYQLQDRISNFYCEIAETAQEKIVLDMSLSSDQSERYCRYEVNAADGSLKQLKLSYTDPSGAQKPLQILEKTRDSFYVQMEQRLEYNTSIQENGSVVTEPHGTTRFGFITFEDFFADKPNYREVKAHP